jgi:heme exporter protein A
MLEALDLECVRGERRLFSGLSFTVSAGQLVHLSGENGSGKTSLMRILCGLHTPYSGSVRWKGRPVASLDEDYHRDLVYVGHLNGIKDELTPLENLAIATTLSGISADAGRRFDALSAFGVSACADLPVRYLSQGQRRRVALSRLALSDDRPLWILDEPFNALDSAAVAQLRQLLAAHVGGGGMVVLTTHLDLAVEGVETHGLNLDLHGSTA